MTEKQKADAKALIEFYEVRGWDWSTALEFFIRYHHRSLPGDEARDRLERKRRAGRPRKELTG